MQAHVTLMLLLLLLMMMMMIPVPMLMMLVLLLLPLPLPLPMLMPMFCGAPTNAAAIMRRRAAGSCLCAAPAPTRAGRCRKVPSRHYSRHQCLI